MIGGRGGCQLVAVHEQLVAGQAAAACIHHRVPRNPDADGAQRIGRQVGGDGRRRRIILGGHDRQHRRGHLGETTGAVTRPHLEFVFGIRREPFVPIRELRTVVDPKIGFAPRVDDDFGQVVLGDGGTGRRRGCIPGQLDIGPAHRRGPKVGRRGGQNGLGAHRDPLAVIGLDRRGGECRHGEVIGGAVREAGHGGGGAGHDGDNGARGRRRIHGGVPVHAVVQDGRAVGRRRIPSQHEAVGVAFGVPRVVRRVGLVFRRGRLHADGGRLGRLVVRVVHRAHLVGVRRVGAQTGVGVGLGSGFGDGRGAVVPVNPV